MIKHYFRFATQRNRIVPLIAKSIKVVFALLVSVALLAGIGAAQSEEELEVLRMFFKDRDLFTSVTRSPKPVSQIAENVTVVTAEEIENMNAHTVAEVLNRIPGLFINFHQGIGSFGSSSILQIQGAERRHVLVMVDGVPWNSLSGGGAETNTIPVGIIERIEIVKGPAASWGSSLGGVVHIITKSAGYVAGPTGAARASYGERNAQDYRAELTGREGKWGYYLFGGRQDSDGFEGSRYFENNSFYSRFSYAPSKNVDAGFSIGYSEPESGLGDYDLVDLASSGEFRALWTTAVCDIYLTRETTFNARLFSFSQKTTIRNDSLGLGRMGPVGALYQESVYDERTIGATAKLVWRKGFHTAVAGVDFQQGDLDQRIDSGQILQMFGVPARFQSNPDVGKTGIYFNDTVVFDRFSITPGVRYDYSTTSGTFLSPSIGLTYELDKETILRGSVSKGFASPPLSWTSGGALFLDPNPSLEEESVWSCQVGLESAALSPVWLKGNLFYHEIDDLIEQRASGDAETSPSRIFVNGGKSRRQGFEIEAETLPFYSTSIRAAMAYVSLDPADATGADEIYGFNIGVAFDDPKILYAELFGRYVWWDTRKIPDAEYDTFIWDLNVKKRMYSSERASLDLFITGHNIFSGSHYLVGDNENPARWLEAGLKMEF